MAKRATNGQQAVPTAARATVPQHGTLSSRVEEDEEEVRVLAPEQLAAFLEHVHPSYRTFFHFLALTGLRWGEATILRWRDLRLDGSRPVVKVRRSIYQ